LVCKNVAEQKKFRVKTDKKVTKKYGKESKKKSKKKRVEPKKEKKNRKGQNFFRIIPKGKREKYFLRGK